MCLLRTHYAKLRSDYVKLRSDYIKDVEIIPCRLNLIIRGFGVLFGCGLVLLVVVQL